MINQAELSTYKENFKTDFRASIVVFLVAVPLCLGIALASGAPLFSGLIAGIIGGTIVSLFSGSQISVSGPAAGLAVVVFEAIRTLGSFDSFLVAVVLAGLIQILMGYMKAGTIGAFFPSNVIKAMLTAIGLILIMKQIPYAIGYTDLSDMTHNSVCDNLGTCATDMVAIFMNHLTPVAVVISIISLVILFLWEKPFIKNSVVAKIMPGALVVVVLGIIVEVILATIKSPFAIDKSQLVSLPSIHGIEGFFDILTTPDWSTLANPHIYIVAVTIAIIASLETLLSLEAADKIDPLKRIAPTNKELKAQGIGNTISGLVGGLPITAVIVRTSANVYNGGKTKTSAFFHGIWLMLSVLFLIDYLGYIPLASLAAILLFVGYKLASPKLFMEVWKQGPSQSIPFIATIVAILFTDLLIGISIGVAVAIFFIIRSNYHQAITLKKDGDLQYTVLLQKNVNFLNKSLLRESLAKIENNSSVVIDYSQAEFIEHDIMETIEDYILTSKSKNIKVETKLPEESKDLEAIYGK